MRTACMTKGISGRTLAQAVLLAVIGGAVVAAALMAPNALQAFRPFIRSRRRPNEERERIRVALRRLKERRLVRVDWKGEEAFLRVTERGKQYVKRLEFDTLALEKPERWDGRWRLVAFDIPERFAAARRALRGKLTALGFLRMQKSLFVYPYPCRDETDFIADFFHVRPYVQYLEASGLDHREGAIRLHFRLLGV